MEFRCRNILINSLSADEYRYLEPMLELTPLSAGQTIIKAASPIEAVYFPLGGVISIHEVLSDGSRVGVGIVGFEGATGWSSVMRCDRSYHEATIAIGGAEALYISVEDMTRACLELPALNKLLLRYVRCFLVQMSRTISSNLRDPVGRRLARWLLMNHDRLEGDEIRLTHDQLGIMLAVRRASVTDALHVLEGEGLILANRGRIRIRDRKRLISFAGEAYGVAEAEYATVIAPFAKLERTGEPPGHRFEPHGSIPAGDRATATR
jgi:CRP-like cAMP-binding protein